MRRVVLFAFLCPNLAPAAVVIENRDIRLELTDAGRAVSLRHKPSATECLVPGAREPMFAALQYRAPAGIKLTPAKHVERNGDRLYVSLKPLVSTAVIRLRVTDAYLGFDLEKIESDASFAAGKARPSEFNEETLPFDELVFVQLPVRERENFGSWLNVAWDARLAVNVLATSRYTRIDAIRDGGARVMRAAAVNAVRSDSLGAAIIVSDPSRLLDRIAQMEADYQLPAGVEARRAPEARYSYWEISEPVTLANVDRHIEVARKAGFRMMQIYYKSFSQSVGHFPWRSEYPGGINDLRAVTRKLAEAGIIPGVHLHFSKAALNDPYVTPKPDPRLNLRRTFTLAGPISADAVEIPVLENPRGVTRDESRRILRAGDELIAYQTYTTEPPYRFQGCRRGALGSAVTAHSAGSIAGLLDLDNWPVYVRFNQNTTIQDEVAARIGDLWREAGFRFAYFDGSEDVNSPFWFHVPDAQWLVFRRLIPAPLFAETSTLQHFNWHMMSRSNAEDPVPAEQIKEFVRTVRIPEAVDRALSFTRSNFGWIRYGYPNAKTTGMQPDILEYVASRAAGFESPISLAATLAHLDATPRTPDNLETLRRWEEFRASGRLTPEQKRALRQPRPEHTLLIDERREFALVPWRQIEAPAPLRAFLFRHDGKIHVAYWDMRGSSTVKVSLPGAKARLCRGPGTPDTFDRDRATLILPASHRRYLIVENVAEAAVEAAFGKAEVK
jgi:hypothetical protein